MSLTQTVSPTVEPITVEEAKHHARISTAADDAYVRALITAARKYCETRQHRQYCTATYVLRLDTFPSEIILPRPPVQSVTSVQYVDTDGVTQTLSSANYQTSLYGASHRIKPAVDKEWPSVREQYDAVIVTYDAGYGSASSVPEDVRLAIKMAVAHWYKFREPVVDGLVLAPVPMGVDALLGMRWVAR